MTTHPQRFIILCIVFILQGCGAVAPCPQEDTEMTAECVIILHGIGRTNRAMEPMAKTLRLEGYRVVNLDYPSRKKSIARICQEEMPKALEYTRQYNCSTIHFVTHSLGGIIARMALQENPPENLGKVVMLSPPNQGSELADYLTQSWFFGWLYKTINGPAGQELTTAPDSVPNQLGPVTYPTGIISGSHHNGFDYWFSKLIPGADDGKVSTEEAKVEGMTDALVLPYHHTSIMKKQEVFDETIHFLRHGAFRKSASEQDSLE